MNRVPGEIVVSARIVEPTDQIYTGNLHALTTIARPTRDTSPPGLGVVIGLMEAEDDELDGNAPYGMESS